MKNYWIYIVIAIVVISFLATTVSSTLQNYQLKKSGVVGYAHVTAKEWKSKGYYYEFMINDHVYKGHTNDKDVKSNDSLEILYLPDNPDVNNPLDFIQSNYGAKDK